MNELPAIPFESSAAWENWLAENHATSQGLWLQIARKESGIASVTYAEALEVALCYGWIDGHKAALDDTYWLQRFTPRRGRSRWSRVNRGKAEALIEQGRMRPAGLREVERARAYGRWDAAYESQSRINVPDDLQAALDEDAAAKAFFVTISRVNRYAILYRIDAAKKPETRRRLIRQYVEMLAEGRTIYP
jgi:uncharacterized protein YdeI (YjbR/CyaY-like superfamily)